MWVYSTNDELYHHGVLGMKWGHRKAQRYQQTLSDASKQASKFAGYAKEDIKKFGDMGDKRSQAVSKKQLTRYEKMSKDWANTKVKDIDRKKIKEAKRFVEKGFFTPADFAYYTYKGKEYNTEDY